MATIPDYLDWRGDIPFSVSPVNEVDDFILCKIGTPDLRGIVPQDASYVPLRRAVEVYTATGGETRLGLVASKQTVPVFRRLPETVRFGELMLTGYRLSIDEERTEQFSALTVRLPDGRHAVTFRGTDDTLVGWKENFLLAVRSATSAQEHAARYLRWAAEVYPGELVLSGHSKGGNLAVYAASMAPPEIQDRIVRICDYDGPGFQESFFRNPGFQRIRGKIRAVIPHNAMVGTLLSQARGLEPAVVRSTVFNNISGHDGFTWEVGPTGFVPAEGLSPSARAFDKAMDQVLTGMTMAEREAFIGEFFGALGSAGAETLTDVTEQRLRQVWQMMRSLQQEPGVRRLVADTLEALIKGYAAERGLSLPRLPRRFRRKNREEEGPRAEP